MAKKKVPQQASWSSSGHLDKVNSWLDVTPGPKFKKPSRDIKLTLRRYAVGEYFKLKPSCSRWATNKSGRSLNEMLLATAIREPRPITVGVNTVAGQGTLPYGMVTGRTLRDVFSDPASPEEQRQLPVMRVAPRIIDAIMVEADMTQEYL